MFRRLAPDTKTMASSLRLIRPRTSPQPQPAAAMLDQRGIEGIIYSPGHTGAKGSDAKQVWLIYCHQLKI